MIPEQDDLIRKLKAMLRSRYYSPHQKEQIRFLLKLAEDANERFEELLEEARMIGARNPSYDGDMVGWLDDDFDADPDR